MILVIVRKIQATRSAGLLHAVLWLDVGESCHLRRGAATLFRAAGWLQRWSAEEPTQETIEEWASSELFWDGRSNQTCHFDADLKMCYVVPPTCVQQQNQSRQKCSTGCGHTMPEAPVSSAAGPGKERRTLEYRDRMWRKLFHPLDQSYRGQQAVARQAQLWEQMAFIQKYSHWPVQVSTLLFSSSAEGHK